VSGAAITQPSLNIRGMSSARIGAQASNVIPASATATLDIRLVKAMNVERTQELVRAFIRKQGYFIVDAEPSAEVRLSHPRVAKVVSRMAPRPGARQWTCRFPRKSFASSRARADRR